MAGDTHASGTHNPGPYWSHYGVLRACFITGLDSGVDWLRAAQCDHAHKRFVL